MFQAYVAIGSKKHTNVISANPYIMEIYEDKLYLKEIDKDEAPSLVYYLIEELNPKEICILKDYITAIGVDEIIRTLPKTLRK